MYEVKWDTNETEEEQRFTNKLLTITFARYTKKYGGANLVVVCNGNGEPAKVSGHLLYFYEKNKSGKWIKK